MANVLLTEAQLPTAVRAQRQGVSAEWRRFRHVQAFIEDHFPLEWEAIRHCGLNVGTYESGKQPGKHRLAPASCRKLPFCIRCTKSETGRRVRTAIEQFECVTPAGKQPRFIHIVQTAPVGNEGQYTGGGDWGRQASQDLGAFGGIVWDVLKEAYGDGIGAIMSYQDFGERAFAKRHPHMDLTLNGWSLVDGVMEPTPRYEFKAGGKERWHQATQRAASRLVANAEPGNVRVHRPLVGVKAYYRVLRYQMRELVDLRKLEYSRDQKLVWWKSYHENRREKFGLNDFLGGLAEYQWRLGAWKRKGDEGESQRLHRRYGHMRDGVLEATQRKVGGQPSKHGKRCPCSMCGDWERVFPDGIDRNYRPLPSLRG